MRRHAENLVCHEGLAIPTARSPWFTRRSFRSSPIPRAAEQSIYVRRESMNKDRQITCIRRQAELAIDVRPGSQPIRLTCRSSSKTRLVQHLPHQHPPPSTSRARSFLHQRSTACCSYCLPADKLFDQAFAALLRVFAGCRFAAPLCCQAQ
jgi:hypothetical protein